MAAATEGRLGIDIDAAFTTLTRAGQVAFGGTGFAGTMSRETLAYLAIRDAGPRYRDRVERMLRRATPAGRIYAATLLGDVDPAAGRKAWRRLSSDDDDVTTISGCIVRQTTVSDYAAAELADYR